jgi:TPR repeat protein
MDNNALFQAKSGQKLYNKFLDGDLEAGYFFGLLVLNTGYKIEPIEGLSKKEQKAKGIGDAEIAIVKAAESNHIPSIIEAADMYFSGRIESGTFGSRLLIPKYPKSIQWYKALLRQEIDDETRSLSLFRLGLIEHMVQTKTTDLSLMYWNKASKIPSESANHALARIAQYHYDEKDYKKAVPLLEAIYPVKPYSAVLLGLCYKHGYGVEINIEKHDELMVFCETETDKK